MLKSIPILFQEFTIAPDNGNNLTEHEFPAPRIATAIRIHPVETNGPLTCLRVGVYGTQGGE